MAEIWLFAHENVFYTRERERERERKVALHLEFLTLISRLYGNSQALQGDTKLKVAYFSEVAQEGKRR